MKVSGVAFALVAFVLVLPITTLSAPQYLSAVVRLWPWLLVGAVGWMVAGVYLIRHILALALRRPGARTQARPKS